MALSRSEIELLIKARNEAQGAFDQLNKQITGVVGGTDKATKGMGGFEQKTKASGVAAQATGVAVGLLAERLARGLVSSFNSTIQAANRLDAGLIGLSSVAKAFGGNAEEAKQAAIDLAKDGLLSVGEAATGLKNLLASGFSLPQATELMLRFKDSAAFGRQGALSFGQAVVSATEGVKNGNSILVDNAGITKNLSQILVEAGFSATDLSKASSDMNVRMALFNGILKEAKPQLGDTARFLDTAAGKQAQFSAQVEIAQQKIGKALQPALAQALTVLQPFVKVIGELAPILVPLTAALAAVVIPLAAMRVASNLAGPALGGMGKEATRLIGIFQKVNASAFGGLVPAIRTVGEEAGLTTTKLGKFGTGLAVVQAAAVGFAVGGVLNKLINQFVDLDGAIERATVKLFNWGDRALVLTQQQEVLARATQEAGRSITNYQEAAEILVKVEQIRQAQFNKSIEVQRVAIEAELALGRITQQTANERLAALEAEQRAQQVQQNRISLSEAIRLAEKQIQDEIKATGLTVGQLTQAMAQNSDGFDKFAKTAGLSAETVKFLQDQLKGQEAAQKKATEETEKAEQAQQKLRDSLQQIGIITKDQVNIQLAEMAALEAKATEEGVPLDRVILALNPRLKELAAQAKASGTATGELADAMDRANRVLGETLPKLDQALFDTTSQIPIVGKEITITFDAAKLAADQAKQAMKDLGITSQAELRKAAGAATEAWQRIVTVYGEKSPEATAAYKKMIDAQREATGQLPSYWETNVFPTITRTVQNIQTAVQGSFAQMILGAKSFGEGFTDVWKSIKAGVLNIFNDIVNAFINGMLKKMLAALSGSQGGFSSGFGGLFSGLGGLFGGGGGGAGIGFGGTPISLAGFGPGGGAGAGGGGGLFGGISGSTLLGGGLAIGGGVQLFNALRSGSRGGSILGGLQTGAGIGTMILPGIGTAIGAGVGALGGWIGSLFGGGAGKKANDVRDQFVGQFAGAGALQQAGVTSFSGFTGAMAELGQLLNDADRLDLFRALIAADTPDKVKNVSSQIVKALDQQQQKLLGLSEAANRYGLSWEDMGQTVRQQKIGEVAQSLLKDMQDLEKAGYDHDAIIRKQADSYAALLAKSQELGTEIPEALRPILQQLIDMGLLVDANGEKLTDLEDIAFQSAQGQVDVYREATTEIKRLQVELTRVIEQQAEAQTDIERKALANRRQELEDFIRDAQRDLQDGFEVPITFRYDDLEVPTAPERPQIEGGAAGGVLANRPGLVLFGEGGETELGGPKSFFVDIFKQLGLGDGGGLGGGQVVVTFGPGSIQVFDAAGLEAAVERRVIPAITTAISGNKRGSRTNLRQALGVT